ncbi:PAS domain S-box protein [Methanolobus mangrovi]|uniref:histidine kinase n=1 Tax=Methanolobus mangrovi TaxID=3072977 RepID=A0AA51UG32_9EURY|nr:CHASE4 domain-containing protein [Methanolobus mangrovi]WMW22617.1 PAS domain S-box protein [Methanolobus mangrovi]
MKIYNKTTITLGIVFLFLFLLTAAVTHYVFMSHTEQIENDVLKDNSQRVQRAFQNEIYHMDDTLYDWSAWDATYEFMLENNSDYITSNFNFLETFTTLNINLVMFYDTDGKLVYKKAVDLTEEKEITIDPDFLEHFYKGSILLHHPSINSSFSGIITLENSPVIVVSRPIIKSDYTGPVAGTIIMGRFLDDSFIEPMEEQTLLPINVQSFENSDLPSDFVSIKEQLLNENYIIKTNNNNIISAYFLVEDIYGKPSFIAKTEMSRLIYKEGLAAISATFYMTLLISVLFALLLSFLLKKNLLSRITSLRNGIETIDFKADINSRLYMNGDDELSDLADNINSMLNSLQETSSIFRSTIESVTYGLIAVDTNREILFINPEFIRMFDLPPEMESEKDAKLILKAISLKTKNPEEFEKGVVDRGFSSILHRSFIELQDGKTIEAYSLPLLNNETIYGRLYTFNEITELLSRENELRKEIVRREEAEDKLLLSEEKFSKIATSANDAIIMVNNGSKTIFWNDAATRMFGYSDNEIMGEDIHSFISPDRYLEAYKSGFKKFTETGLGPVVGNTIELEGKRKDGTEFPIELSLSSMQLSDGTWNAAAIIRDISERKRLDNMEHDLLERLTTIINNINSGILLIDRENKTIADVNPVASEMIGLPRDSIIGNICHKFVCPAQEEQCPIIDLGQKVDLSEKFLLDKNGKKIPIIKSVVSVNLKGKEYLVESFYDISSRKKVEEALISAKIAAEASDRAKSEFLANMSHELRTPLNSIIGFSDMLIYNEHDVFDERQTRYLTNISNSGKHLLEVINDILDLSKIEAGKMDLVTEEFDIYDVLDEVKKTVSTLAIKKGLSLEFDIDDDIRTITADRLKLKQILYNLIGNAIKFTMENGSIHVSAKRVLNNIEIEVKDSGIGIHPDDQKKLFEPFRQIESALNRNYDGSGLGLTIVRKYIEMHGGKIRVESEPDKGSSFIFELPL